ncbi:MAG: hypothetical protein FWC15_03455 [Fibromonadales bacterium]|nr:hypothetical protein [Fibromonadales bacterium]
MFRVSSKFVVAFMALALTALVSILAACGDSGSNSVGGGDSSSSGAVRPPSSAVISPDISTHLVSVSLNEAGSELDIIVQVSAFEEMTFDRIDVQLNGVNINGNNAGKGLSNYEFREERQIGKQFCDGETYSVVSYVYMDNKADPIATAWDSFKRNVNICNPPSSSSVSSSSAAVVLTFQKIQFDGRDTLTLNSTDVGARGVIFNSATGTPTVGAANVYYDASGNAGTLKAGSAAKIITSFDQDATYTPGNYNYSEVACWINQPPLGIMPPQNTSQLRFHPTDGGVDQFEYRRGIYYMIRTNNASGGAWTTNDYLMAIPDQAPAQSGSNRAIKIVAWRVVP